LSALDAQIRKRLRDELKRLQCDTGFTAIMVTHDQEEALVLGDQVAVMNAGRIVQAGPAREIYDRPATRFVAGFIGDFNLLEPDAVARVRLAHRLRLGHPTGSLRRAAGAAGGGGGRAVGRGVRHRPPRPRACAALLGAGARHSLESGRPEPA